MFLRQELCKTWRENLVSSTAADMVDQHVLLQSELHDGDCLIPSSRGVLEVEADYSACANGIRTLISTLLTRQQMNKNLITT